ncbi:MAG: D-sedoheptulose-7-phosphate isomerase, partial [Planctomycetota bacterium]
NDYRFDASFARQVEAHVGRGDVVIAISTSGNSKNVLEGVRAARQRGAVTVAFTGKGGGKLAKLAHLCLRVPATGTARVQECHITAGHAVCDAVEDALFR